MPCYTVSIMTACGLSEAQSCHNSHVARFAPLLWWQERGTKHFPAWAGRSTDEFHRWVLHLVWGFGGPVGLNVAAWAWRKGRAADVQAHDYETEHYAYPPINIYSIQFKTGILYSKQLVYVYIWAVEWSVSHEGRLRTRRARTAGCRLSRRFEHLFLLLLLSLLILFL